MKKPVSTLVLLVLSVIGIKAYSNANVSGHILTNTARTNATSGYILTGNAGVPAANVSVKNAAAAKALKAFPFLAAPSITAFSPSRAGIGNIVTISGTDLTGATAVKFGDSAAVSFTVVSPTSITAVVGAGASGNVQVVTPAGTVTMAGFQFVPPPTITEFTPSSAAEFDEVTITGNNFIGVKDVSVAGVSPQVIRILGPTKIKVTLHFTTSGSIEVTTIGGKATIAGFTFINRPPTITSFSPAAAARNDQVSITGINFSGATHVYIGGVETSFTVPLPTLIVANVTSANSGRIMVITPGGTATSATDLSYIPEPIITSFGPATAAQGDTVTIKGTDLTGASAVNFGGSPAAYFSVVSSTSIAAVVGAGTSGNVQVVTPGGTATSATGLSYIPEPKITSFGLAKAAKGDTVTITGTDLTGASAVNFGGIPAASFSVVSSTSIAAVVGAGASGNVQVITHAGIATMAGFEFVPTPSISSFYPDSSPWIPGYTPYQSITITGSNFSLVKAVNIGGMPAFGYFVITPMRIRAFVDPRATRGSVEVITAGGKVTLAGFIPDPTISSFKPTTAIRGDTVTITGTNFTGATSVRFGGVPAASYTVTSPTSILAKLDSGASGNITVTTPDRTATSGQTLTFLPPPTITSFSPTAGAGYDWVYITGTNFIGAIHVFFGGVEAPAILLSPTAILTGRAELNSGKVMVTTLYGTATSATDFTYYPEPTITSFSPATAAEGDTVTITGTNFTGATNVTFGGVPAASFTVTSPTSILAKVGPGVSGSVVVKTAGGEVSSPNSFTFLSGATITSFSPAGAKQGDTVIITGTNFNYPVWFVRIGGVPASFKVISPTTILATVGAGASGKITVVVSGNEVNSATDFIFFPEIISFSPAKVAQGDTVTITGTKFTGATNVMFGSSPAASFTVTSPTTILATVGSAPSGNITVTTPYGTASSAAKLIIIPPPYFYPDWQLPGGRYTRIDLFGHHLTGATHAYIGGVEVHIISVTAELIIIGGNIANGGLITVTTPGGTASAGFFTFVPEPTITSFSPATAAAGDIVTITGTDFTYSSQITFGGVPAALYSTTVISPTSISAKIGPLGATGKVMVSTAGGTAYSATNLTFLSGAAIASFSPTTAAKGDIVTITGTNFTGATNVTFGGVPATSFTVTSPTSISATVGAGAGGKVMVLVGGNEVYSATDLTFLRTEITSFGPTTVAQGDTVTITGTRFTGATNVMFGSAPAAYFTVTSPTTILATVGPGSGGKITVTTPDGTASSATKLAVLPPPTILPFYNQPGGRDSRISIFGHHLSGTTHVYIGGVEIALIRVTAELVIAGGNMVKSGIITITTPGGTATAGYFTYIPEPAIISFSPVKAAQGDTVTITGINFAVVTNVTFGGVPAASFTVKSPTSISATVGSGASGKIVVTTPGITATSATDLTFLPPPAITSFTPTAAGPGATVIINGFNFRNVTAVSIGGVPTSFSVLSTTAISARVAANATRGNVEVTTTGGKQTVGGFTFLPKPVITSYSPTRASSGDVVTITGTNFNDVTAVRFNNVVPARSFTVVSSTSIIATVGAGASGNVNVITTGGASSKPGFIYIQAPTITAFSAATAAQGGIVSSTSILAKLGPGGTATSATDLNFLLPTAVTSFTQAKAELKETHTNILEDIIAYPSPFTNSLTLKLGDKVFKKLKVELLSYFGKVLYSKEFVDQAGEVTLDLSDLGASQIYILKLSADNTQYISKIAKK